MDKEEYIELHRLLGKCKYEIGMDIVKRNFDIEYYGKIIELIDELIVKIPIRIEEEKTEVECCRSCGYGMKDRKG